MTIIVQSCIQPKALSPNTYPKSFSSNLNSHKKGFSGDFHLQESYANIYSCFSFALSMNVIHFLEQMFWMVMDSVSAIEGCNVYVTGKPPGQIFFTPPMLHLVTVTHCRLSRHTWFCKRRLEETKKTTFGRKHFSRSMTKVTFSHYIDTVLNLIIGCHKCSL